MHRCQSQPPNPSHLPLHSLVSFHLFSISVSLFLLCKEVHLYHFSRSYIPAFIRGICFSLSVLLHSVWQSLGPVKSLQMAQLQPFYGWVIFHWIWVPHLLCGLWTTGRGASPEPDGAGADSERWDQLLRPGGIPICPESILGATDGSANTFWMSPVWGRKAVTMTDKFTEVPLRLARLCTHNHPVKSVQKFTEEGTGNKEVK